MGDVHIAPGAVVWVERPHSTAGLPFLRGRVLSIASVEIDDVHRTKPRSSASPSDVQVTVELISTGSSVKVAASAVYPASEDQPAEEDLSLIDNVNEPEVLLTLRQRYRSGKQYTSVGDAERTLGVVSFNTGAESDVLDAESRVPLHSADFAEELVAQFETCAEAPAEPPTPHVYGVYEAAVRRALEHPEAGQAVVVTGCGGSGKTSAIQNILEFACLRAAPAERNIPSRLAAAVEVVDAFTSAYVGENSPSSSQCVTSVELVLDADSGGVAGARVHASLFSTSCVIRRPPGQAAYDIVHQLLAGATRSERASLRLRPAQEYRYIAHSNWSDDATAMMATRRRGSSLSGVEMAQKIEHSGREDLMTDVDGVPMGGKVAGMDAAEYARLRLDSKPDRDAFDAIKFALTRLSCNAEVQACVFQALSAVLALGQIKFEVDPAAPGSDRASINQSRGRDGTSPLADAAYLLGVERETLHDGLIRREGGPAGGAAAYSVLQAETHRDTAAQELYSGVLDWVVSRSNEVLRGNAKPASGPSTDARSASGGAGKGSSPSSAAEASGSGDPADAVAAAATVRVVDAPSLRTTPHASLDAALNNFAVEKLRHLFVSRLAHDDVIAQRLDGVDPVAEVPAGNSTDNAAVVGLFDAPGRGMLPLLGEMCLSKAVDDVVFYSKMLLHARRDGGEVLVTQPAGARARKGGALAFSVQHSLSTSVTYDAAGWVRYNRAAVPDDLVRALTSSKNDVVAFVGKSLSARQAESRRPSVAASAKLTSNTFVTSRRTSSIKDLIRDLSKRRLSFVWCIDCRRSGEVYGDTWAPFVDSDVLRQIRDLDLVVAVSKLKYGLSRRIDFEEFIARFSLAQEPSRAAPTGVTALQAERRRTRLLNSSVATARPPPKKLQDAKTRARSLLRRLWSQFEPRIMRALPVETNVRFGKSMIFITEHALSALEVMRYRAERSMDWAAVKLQSSLQMNTARATLRRQRSSAILIQAQFRGRQERARKSLRDTARLFLLARAQRRRHHKLRRAVRLLQSGVRGWLQEGTYHRVRVASRRLHFLATGFLLRARLIRQHNGLVMIQALIRDWLVRRRVNWTRVRAALLMQAAFRGNRWRRRHPRLVAILAKRIAARRTVLRLARLQATFRMRQYRAAYLAVLSSIVTSQAFWRGAIDRHYYHRKKRAVPKMQALVRRFLARVRFSKQLEARHVAEEEWRLNTVREREILQLAHTAVRLGPIRSKRAEKLQRQKQWRDRCRRRENAMLGKLDAHTDTKSDPSEGHLVFDDFRIVDVDPVIDTSEIYEEGWAGAVGELDAVLRKQETQRMLAEIAIGGGHTVLRDTSGRIYTFGWGERGQLGLTLESKRKIWAKPSKSGGGVAAVEARRVAASGKGKQRSKLKASAHAVASRGKGAEASEVVEVMNMAKPAPVVLRYPPTEFSIASPKNVVVTHIAAGQNHTLVLTSTGAVFSWGAGKRGQLGHGEFADQARPRYIEALSTRKIRSIATGNSHSIAVSDIGRTFTWGVGDLTGHPPLRPGDAGYDDALAKLRGETKATASTEKSGRRFMMETTSVAKQRASKDRTTVYEKSFRPLSPLKKAKRVPSKREITLSAARGGAGGAQRSDKSDRAAEEGVLQVATPTASAVSRAEQKPKAASAAYMKGVDILQRAMKSGMLRFRAAQIRQSETPDIFRDVATPKPVSALNNIFVTQIACGQQFSVAVTDTGHVYSWGHNERGSLGIGHCIDEPKPTLVWPPSEFALRAADARAKKSMFAAALEAIHNKEKIKGDGAGASIAGLLEYDHKDDRMALEERRKAEAKRAARRQRTPRPLRGKGAIPPSPATAASPTVEDRSEAAELLASADERAHKSWLREQAARRVMAAQQQAASGAAFVTQGRGVQSMPTSRQERTLVSITELPEALPELERACTAISAGARHVVMMTRFGSVLSWGDNKYGQLGVGDSLVRVLPTYVEVPEDDAVRSVAAGLRNSAATTTSGKLFGWGRLGSVPPVPSVDDPAPLRGPYMPVADFAVPVEIPFGSDDRCAMSVHCSWSHAMSTMQVQYKDVYRGVETKWTADLGADVRGRVLSGGSGIPGSGVTPSDIVRAEEEKRAQQREKREQRHKLFDKYTHVRGRKLPLPAERDAGGRLVRSQTRSKSPAAPGPARHSDEKSDADDETLREWADSNWDSTLPLSPRTRAARREWSARMSKLPPASSNPAIRAALDVLEQDNYRAEHGKEPRKGSAAWERRAASNSEARAAVPKVPMIAVLVRPDTVRDRPGHDQSNPLVEAHSRGDGDADVGEHESDDDTSASDARDILTEFRDSVLADAEAARKGSFRSHRDESAQSVASPGRPVPIRVQMRLAAAAQAKRPPPTDTLDAFRRQQAHGTMAVSVHPTASTKPSAYQRRREGLTAASRVLKGRRHSVLTARPLAHVGRAHSLTADVGDIDDEALEFGNLLAASALSESNGPSPGAAEDDSVPMSLLENLDVRSVLFAEAGVPMTPPPEDEGATATKSLGDEQSARRTGERSSRAEIRKVRAEEAERERERQRELANLRERQEAARLRSAEAARVDARVYAQPAAARRAAQSAKAATRSGPRPPAVPPPTDEESDLPAVMSLAEFEARGFGGTLSEPRGLAAPPPPPRTRKPPEDYPGMRHGDRAEAAALADRYADMESFGRRGSADKQDQSGHSATPANAEGELEAALHRAEAWAAKYGGHR